MMTESYARDPVFLNHFELHVPDRRVYFRIGYKSRQQEVPENVRDLVREMRRIHEKLIQPRAVYQILDYKETNRHSIFADSQKTALCICSIGPELEQLSQQWMQKNQILKGFILDSFGSEAAEALAKQCDAILVDKALTMNLWPSKRFSPGYGKWDISQQKYVFEVLPAEKIGVRLSDACMMIPRKSVSFRINFYADRSQTTRRLNPS
jgi:hypothetical protein